MVKKGEEMRPIICIHAVEKAGTIYLVVRNENSKEYTESVFTGTIEELEQMVANGELIITRKPATELERKLSEAPEKNTVVKKLSLIRDLEEREEVSAIIEQAIEWIKNH